MKEEGISTLGCWPKWHWGANEAWEVCQRRPDCGDRYSLARRLPELRPLPIHPAAATSHAITGWFWAAVPCPASIILSGIVANFRDNWQLTAPEAWSCGLLFWFAKPKTVPAGNHWSSDFRSLLRAI